eukprot:6456968-Amphidinium_carterae.2
MSARQRDALSGTYLTLLRKLTHLQNPELLRHVSDEKLLDFLGEPSLEQLFDHRIAVHMAKSCSSNNPQLRAALRCRSSASVWSSWLSTLTRLHRLSPNLHHMPVPHLDHLGPWMDLMAANPHGWKLRSRAAFITARKAQTDLTKIYTIIADAVEVPPDGGPALADPYEDALPDEYGDADEKPFECPLCPARFKANQGLCVHKLRHHGLIPPLSLRARGTTCEACNAHLGTRHRLLLHLNGKLSCALWTIHNIQPMSQEEYAESVGKLNQIDDRLTRAHLPKTGPIPRVGDQYVSQRITPLDPFLDDGDNNE